MKLFRSPYLEILMIILMIAGFLIEYLILPTSTVVLIFILIGASPTLIGALTSIYQRKITIDTFNAFAVVISIVVANYPAVMFIILMLAFAGLLDWQIESRSEKVIEELLKLKPLKAHLETKDGIKLVKVEKIKRGDILVVKTGERIAVDGQVITGEALINQATITGESLPVRKLPGDTVFSSTLNESGMIKVRATDIGKDSTIERMAALIEEAASNKSNPEKLADRFAGLFLPIVVVLGIITYVATKDLSQMAAVFLVACADDIAVAIPLAISASIGQAAKRGIIIKGGNRLDMMRKVRSIVLDKTGTLTYGEFRVRDVTIESWIDEKKFWHLVGSAEKYSEHPIGRAIVHKAVEADGTPVDPEKFEVIKGTGLHATIGKDEVYIGDIEILDYAKVPRLDQTKKELQEKIASGTLAIIVVNKKVAGYIVVADEPRKEAKTSIQTLLDLGVPNIEMFTGDNESIAKDVAKRLGIKKVRASMSPEDKLRAIEQLQKNGGVAMIGDGVNDSPSLARADLGIAMGGTGAAVSVEAADIIILNDDLMRIPDIVRLSRKTFNVVRLDIIIWVVTNVLGFTLVWLGLIGPALAAAFNFITDFLPLINSARLFKKEKW